MMGQYNRDVSIRKALRKRRISRYDYCYRVEEKDYYDNLHQYSKNKIHCSCPMCSTKTKNKGKRKKGNYHRARNYKRMDVRRLIDMDQDLEETSGIRTKRRVVEWI